jgi:hypothetical protein
VDSGDVKRMLKRGIWRMSAEEADDQRGQGPGWAVTSQGKI